MRICEYCQTQENDSMKVCSSCGAYLPENRIEKHEPFFYHGYMVWPEYMSEYDRRVFHFWLGERLIHTIAIDSDVFRQFVEPGTDHFGLVWDLFKLAIGEEEVLRVQRLNGDFMRPASFEVRYIESDEVNELRGLSYDDMLRVMHERRIMR